jgi:enoyl-CoA hydratase/carnithine racemase
MTTVREQILVERREGVVVVTLHRPEKLNAWTTRMMRELSDAVRDANDDAGVGAIVVTGAGRAFCAGADIGAVFSGDDSPGRSASERPAEDARAERDAAMEWVSLCRASKPIVAAINGAAIGVGVTLVLPFDQILAAEGAKLSVRFVKLGLVPELASTHLLVARCGFGAASWLALSGETILAEEALRLRLVDRVCAPGALLDEAVAVAATLGGNPSFAVRMVKELLTQNGVDSDLDAVQARELEAIQRCYASPDHQQAVRAFLERPR